MADAFSIVRKHKPVAAFGVGGYAAGPMLLATWLRGIPSHLRTQRRTRLHQQSSRRLSRKIATGYSITFAKIRRQSV